MSRRITNGWVKSPSNIRQGRRRIGERFYGQGNPSNSRVLMSLKGMCYKAGRYARRSDPYRREYYSTYQRHPGQSRTPAPGPDVSPVGGCGVAIFVLGGLFALACPPLGVIFILVGGLVASGSAVASNRREQSPATTPPLPPTPAAIQPDEKNRARLIFLPLPPRIGKPVKPEYTKCSCGCCDQVLEYNAECCGRTVTCPACQQQIVLPRADPTNENET